MNYISLEFIILLAATFILYFLVGLLNKLVKKTVFPQWGILLIGSLVFYGFTNYVYLIYLGGGILVTYLATILIQYKIFRYEGDDAYVLSPCFIPNHMSRRKYENVIAAVAIIINVGVLAVLKYYNFFASSVTSIIHVSLSTRNFILPLGISFYTFSLISYIVDCCKRETTVERNPFKFILFVSYFPKILQGPISSYDKMKENGLFSSHSFLENNYLKILFRISVGMIKKLAIANVIGLYVDGVYSNISSTSGSILILTSVLYSIQLYCDFSGFIDISIGVSELFGIKLDENFDMPYLATSIQEFWRRWHISLGAWLRKYVYIPLGGNRVPVWRWVINILIVWLISGIWHGANWTFVLWGLMHGILLVLTGLPTQIKKSKQQGKQEKPAPTKIRSIIGIAVTFFFVNLSWVLFRSDSLHQAKDFIFGMVQPWRAGTYNAFDNPKQNILLAIGFALIALLILYRTYLAKRDSFVEKLPVLQRIEPLAKYVLTCVFFAYAIFMAIYLSSFGGDGSAFIYFDF